MKKRSGNTATFSISVDLETRSILKKEAARSYDGNVSALVAAIAKEETDKVFGRYVTGPVFRHMNGRHLGTFGKAVR